MQKENLQHRILGTGLILILSLSAGISQAVERDPPHRIFERDPPHRIFERDPPHRIFDQSGAFISLDGHLSLLSDITDWSLIAGTFGYGARGGYRFRGWGLFVQCEHNMWLATEQGSDVVQGAVNIGIGADVLYAWGFVRTSLALGPSILAFDTVLDDAGEVGVFLDLRPVGLRWPVHKMFTIGFDPITFALVAPVLGGIPLIYTQYRTILYLEVTL